MPFQKGNHEQAKRKHPGRHKRAFEEKFIGILRSSVSADDWQQVVAKALDQARNGDTKAREWLSNWMQGKVPDRIEHSGPEGEPVAIEIVDYENWALEHRPAMDSEAEGSDSDSG
jgi:hypothetical protein